MYAAEQSMVFRVLILKQGVTLNRIWALVVHSLQAKLHFLHCGCRDYLANQASNYPLVVQCRSLPPIQWLIQGRGSGGSPTAPLHLILRLNWGPKGPKKIFLETALPLISHSRWLPPPSPPSEGLDPPLLFVRQYVLKVNHPPLPLLVPTWQVTLPNHCTCKLVIYSTHLVCNKIIKIIILHSSLSRAHLPAYRCFSVQLYYLLSLNGLGEPRKHPTYGTLSRVIKNCNRVDRS